MDPENCSQFWPHAGHHGYTYTSVESVPTDPQDARTNHHKADVVWLEVLSIMLQTRTDPVRTGESSSSRAQMNDIPSRVVNDSHLEQIAAAP